MKQKVAILYGGPSSEHEVSINSAKNVIENIDRSKFEVIEIFISKEGVCNFNNEESTVEEVIKELKTKCDIVFPVLHGTFGEDGALQELLEKEHIAFVGSGSVSSKIAIDKHLSNELFLKHGLTIPRSQIISKDKSIISINFPIILKPVCEGSSVGLYKCNSLEEYQNISEDIFKNHDEMLVQEFVTGREFTCGVLEIEGKNTALPVSEIILHSDNVFDYETKYTAGACTETTPAQIDQDFTKRIQEIALTCHKILGCKSISRTDCIGTESDDIFVLETNTLPGMTKTSFIPAQAEAMGLSMMELVTLLLKSAKK